jgi:hypothetical protein
LLETGRSFDLHREGGRDRIKERKRERKREKRDREKERESDRSVKCSTEIERFIPAIKI